jgi:hypothetical protein
MKVVADVDLDRSKTLVNVMMDETFGGDLCEFSIEGLCNDRVESEGLERLDFLFEGIEETKIPFRLEYAARVWLECIEDRFTVQ